jgi:hypothetical protein
LKDKRKKDNHHKKPLVAIVVVNWNGVTDTIECLDSLHNISYTHYFIIVIDNGSKNNEAETLKGKFPTITLLKNRKNEGYAKANNKGITLGLQQSAEYILLLNNDTIVRHDFLDILVTYAEKNDQLGVISPKILYYHSEKIWSMGGKLYYILGFPLHIGKGEHHTNYIQSIQPDFASGCAMLIKKKVFEKVGMLDPDYFAYSEDADFSYRAKNAGFTIKVIPKSIIWHKKSASAGTKGSNKLSPTQAYLRARNGFLFGEKNLRGIKKISYFLGQVSFRLLYGIVFCDSLESLKQYAQGIVHGIRFKRS